MIEGEGKTLLYTGDLAASFVDYPKIVFERDFDAILCELAHFEVDKNMPEITKSRTKQLIFTHATLKKLAALEEVKDKFPYPMHIATDTASFDI